MKSKSVTKFVALSVSVLGLAVAGLFAAEKATAAKPEKKPEMKVDSSPVSDAKSTVVLSYADSLEAIRPAVVSVHSQKMVKQRIPEYIRPFLGNVPDQERAQSGLGSGVIIASNGYILTNNHVVEGADELKVLLNDEREYTAKVIGTDPKTDVAVIKIEADNLPAATLADSSKLRIGDVVFAIGNPLGVGQTVTMGIVSATSRRVGILDAGGYEDFIQTDAAINQGNSGGALIDARGRLVGINSAILSTSQGNIGIGFAIPINLASSIMHSLIDTGTVTRGYLGVSTDVVTADMAESFGLKPNQKGVVITDLNPADGPAAKAGLKREDVIIAINDKPITSVDDLRLLIAQTPPDTKIDVKYIRNGKSENKQITLGKLDDNSGPDGELITGVTVSTISPELRKEMRIDDRVQGLVITDVANNSPYSGILPQGAVIEQINRVPAKDIAAAKGALRDGRNIALVYYRGIYRYVPFTVR